MYIILPKRHFGDTTSPSNKKREKPEIRRHFNHHDAQIQNQKAGPHELHAQAEIEEKMVVNFGVFPGFCFPKFKNDLRNKNSICFWNSNC